MIRIRIEDHTGNLRHEANIEEKATVEKLIPAIITALGLPTMDPSGRMITYHLSYNNRRLEEKDTLAASEVRTGETITIVPEMTAGVLTMPNFLQPLVVLQPVACKRLAPSTSQQELPIATRSSKVQVSFSSASIERIWAQARAQQKQEIGGLLAGYVYDRGEHFLVHVAEVLAAEDTQAGPGHLTFTYATWAKLLQKRQEHPNADLLTLGWYHSHPGFGIFLSQRDEFIHRMYFSNLPWYIALVVDPCSNDWGVFTLEDGNIIRCS